MVFAQMLCNIRMRNITNFILVLFTLIVFDASGQSDSAIFKSVIEASYSLRTSSMMSRDSAFVSNVSRHDFYNEEGKLIEYHTYESTGVIWEIAKINRSDNGLNNLTLVTNENGDLKRSWESKFNSDMKLVESKQFDPSGVMVQIQKNQYDEVGNMVLMTIEDLKREWTHKTTYKYDDNGNAIEMFKYNPARKTTDKRTYKFDEEGNEIEQELIRENGDYTKFVSEYDQMGNLLEMYWYDKAGTLTDQTSFTYEYDNHANWTTKTRGSNGKVTSVWEREIEYW